MQGNIENGCACGCDCGSSLEFKEFDLVLEKYKDLPGNLIILLQNAQDIYGYISREIVSYISQKTGIPKSRIYGVATFYTQFRLKPTGKHLILLCQGTACHVSGSQLIEEAIFEELNIKEGETTEDGLFTLNNVACLGCCSLAPVMMIQSGHEDETYGKLTKESVKEILRSIKEKELVEEFEEEVKLCV